MKKLTKTCNKRHLEYIFLLTFVWSLPFFSWSQPYLATNGVPGNISVDDCCNGDFNELSKGESQDYYIPDDAIFNGINALTFSLRGGDGGFAKAGDDCKSVGGDGATVIMTCLLGYENNQLAPGGKIRFIVGKHGEDSSTGGTAGTGGGGGGGTAVLYQASDGDDWVILAVAGGGGGAYQGNLFGGCIDSQKGAGGRDVSSGGKGGGDDGGNGGTNGGAGSTGDGGAFSDAGYGGGAYDGGSGSFSDSDENGAQGYPDGGNGGDNSFGSTSGNYGRGGFGFGGGGSAGGGNPGAGGGGYSGGGSGEAQENGGGGGSYINPDYRHFGSLNAGGSSGSTNHGSVVYMFEEVCTPKIAYLEEVEGFCGNTSLFATAQIQVHTTGTENCDDLFFLISGTGGLNINQTGTFNLAFSGNYTIQIAVSVDGSLNIIDSETITVSIVDVVPPVAKCISSYTIDLLSNPQSFANFEDIINDESYDNCGIASLAVSKSTFGCGDIGTQDVTLTVTDMEGNASQCTTAVTIADTNPSPNLGTLPNITASCAAVVDPPTATDACEGTITGIANGPSAFYTPGTHTINWVYTDSKGNSATQQQTVIISDDSPPTAICPADITIELDPGDCNTTVDYYASSSDNCENQALPVTYTGVTVDNNTFTVPAGTDRLLLVQVANPSSNELSSVTFNGMPLTQVLFLGPNVSLQMWYLLLGSGDAIDGTGQISGLSFGNVVSYITFENVDQDNPFGDSDQGKNKQYLKLEARNKDMIYEGNAQNGPNKVDGLSGQIEIFDQRNSNFYPSLSWGAYKPVNADGIQTLEVDRDYGKRGALVIRARHATSYAFDIDPGSTFEIGTTPVIFTVTDKANQSSVCAFNVTVNDQVDPEITCPDNIILDANLDNNGGCTASTTFEVTATDDCSTPTISQTKGLASGADFPIGTTTNTFVATDGGGRTALCFFTVTVNDTQAPEALCQNKTIQLDANGSASISTTDINDGSNDNCGNIASLSLDVTNFDCDDVGTHTVTLTVKDDYNNTSTCQATVTVQDNIAPTAVCQNVIVQLDANGEGSITAADIGGNSTDICGIGSLSIGKTSFNCDDEGSSNIQLTVKDANNNTSTCNAVVTVQDNIAPVALCQNKTVQLDANGEGSITATDINNNSTDACGISFLSLDNTSYTCTDIGTHTVTLTVEDENDNESTCQATVTVEDNVAPIALCQNHTIQLDAAGTASISTADIDNNSNDACGIASLSLDYTDFACDHVGDNTITLNVTDNNGNNSSCQAIVTVEDDIAPVALCKNHTVALDANGQASISTADIDNGSNDACGITNLSLDNTSFNCNAVGGNNTVTLTVVDNNSNSSTCQASITVEDNTAPTALCKDVIVSLDSEGNGVLSVGEVNNNSYDNCGIASMSISQTQFSCNDLGVKNVTLTVTDVNGHVSTCISNIDTEVGGELTGGWSSNDIGQVTIGNEYWYDPCEYPPLYYVTGSGNNATNMMADNVAFTSYSMCGNATLTAKIESIDPNGYGGLMIREGMSASDKQVSIFSNMSNMLRHEVRYTSNAPKQINSFFRPNSIWLRLERQGDWIFSYSSYDGTNFQYVHGVFLPMQSCVEIGLASFTYLPNAQTETVFSNVSISGSNGGFSANDDGLANTAKPQHLNTETPQNHTTVIPQNHNTITPNNLNLFPNPNQGQFTIQLDKPIEENATVYIYNQYGQQVHSEQLQQGATQLQFYLEQLASGTYWLKMNGASHTIATQVFTVIR